MPPSHWSVDSRCIKNRRKCFRYVYSSMYVSFENSNTPRCVYMYPTVYHKWIFPHKHQRIICIVHSRELFRNKPILFLLVLSHVWMYHIYLMLCTHILETRPTNTDLPLCQTAEHFSNATKRVLNIKKGIKWKL